MIPGPMVRAGADGQMSNAARVGVMLAAMFFFAVADAVAKLLATRMGAPFVLAGQGIGGVILFLPVCLIRGEFRDLGKLLSWPVAIRNFAEFVAPASMLYALTVTPLAVFGALMQLQPLFVLALAAVFLREPVGWHRWSSVVVGFASVLLILRPGSDGFSPVAGFILFGVFFLAMRDIATRLIDTAIPVLLLTTVSFAVMGIFGGILTLVAGLKRPPTAEDYGIVLVLVFAAGMAFNLTTIALRSGDVAAVTPFRYSRLIFVLVIGVVLFGERPDIWVLTGAALIVLSGLYVFWRERSLDRRQRRAAASAVAPGG